MKTPATNSLMKETRPADERGFSVLELLIVVAMIGVVTAFAFVRVVESQRSMEVSNSAREFMSYLEKARIDSIRRHAQAPAEMAKVTITSPTTYDVTADFEGNGIVKTRTINLPLQGMKFSVTTFPTIIMFNWRGRTVDTLTGQSIITPPNLNIADNNNHTANINITSSGETATNSNISYSPVTTSTVSVNLRPKSTVP